MRGQTDVSAALPPGKEYPVTITIEYEAAWIPKPVWILQGKARFPAEG